MDTRSGGVRGTAISLDVALPKLFWVTDDTIISRADFLRRARSAMEAGGPVCAVQLRAHRSSGSRLYELAVRLRAVATETGARLWINDRVDVAIAVRADGVQVGRLGLAVEEARRVMGRACPVGCSVHGPDEAKRCVEQGADLVVLGNVFATASHPDRTPIGLDALRRVAALGRPIVAIGGISTERVEQVMEAGAWGVAVLSGVWAAADSGAAAERYARVLCAAEAGRSDR